MSTKERVTAEIAPELFVRVHTIALAWAKSHTSNDTADDVAAEVTLNMLRRGRTDLTGLSERGELDRFVVTATRNEFRSRRRSEKRRATYEAAFAAEPRLQQPYGMSPEHECDYGDLVRAVAAALEQIWPERRRMFLMVTEDRMTYKAVGAELGMSARQVERLTQCTRQDMQEYLAEYRAAALATRRARKTRNGDVQ